MSQLSTSQSALQALQTALQSFESATQTLASSQNWNAVSATSTNTSAFTVTTSPGAQPSTYSISVTSLATNQIDIQNLSSQYQNTETGPSNLTSGTIAITPKTANNGKAVTFNVTAGESLDSIVSSINQQSATTGVQASVINNGQNQYLLALSSTQTGTANGFSISGTLIGSGSGQIQFPSSPTSGPTNATITLDGQTITSSTNTFTNSIPNVTIQVSQTGSGTLNVSSDTSSVVKSVQTWMNSYNSLVDLLRKDTAYTPSSTSSSSGQASSGTVGPLFNDPNATALLEQLPAQLTQMFTTSNPAVSSLASIGIVVDPTNGHLEFQPASGFSFSGGSTFSGSLQNGQTMFENAVSSSASSVEQLFGVVQNNSLSTAIPNKPSVLYSMYNTLQTFLYGANGVSPIQGDLNSISAQKTSINSYLNMVNSQINQQIANYTSQLNALNAAMQQSQMQMQKLGALFGGGSSSASSSTIP